MLVMLSLMYAYRGRLYCLPQVTVLSLQAFIQQFILNLRLMMMVQLEPGIFECYDITLTT
jgi:hypothetical protein